MNGRLSSGAVSGLSVRLLAAALAAVAAAPAFATGATSPADQSKAPVPVMPSFVEETRSSGLSHVFEGDWQYMVGGGVASFDCNSDDFEDLVLAGGSAPAALFTNRSESGGPLAFQKEAGTGVELDGVLGAYPLDANGDGIGDLVLLRFGENVILKGQGGCTFTRANEEWGFDGGDAWSTALAAMWEKGAAWPTIAIGNYIDRFEEFSPWGSCTDNWLHRPQGTAFRRAGCADAEPLPAFHPVHGLEPLRNAVAPRLQ
jgi:enediyne biosynthesis protein E4